MKSILVVAAIIVMGGLAVITIHRLNTISEKIAGEQTVEQVSHDQTASYQGQELVQVPAGSLQQLFLDGIAYAKGLIIPGIIGLLLLGILGSTNFFKALEEHLKW